MKIIKKIIFSKEALIGVVAGIGVLLIFLTVYLTASSQVSENTAKLRVGIVNLDESYSEEALKQFEKQLPFTITQYKTTEQATDKLVARELEMVIALPEDFSSDLAVNKKAEVQYYVNQGQSMTAISIMNTAVVKINDTLNQNIHTTKTELLGTQLESVFEAVAASQKASGSDDAAGLQLAQTATSLTDFAKNLAYQSVTADKIEKNQAQQVSTTLFPTIALVTLCLSGLIFLLLMNGKLAALRAEFGKWRVFVSSQVVFGLFSLVVAVLEITFAKLFAIPLFGSMGTTLLFFAASAYAAICLVQISFLLFGMAGQMLNFLFFAMQVVASGVLISRVLLPPVYQTLTAFLPGPAIIDGLFAKIYGGTGISADIYHLLRLTAGYLLLSVIILFFKKDNKAQTEGFVL